MVRVVYKPLVRRKAKGVSRKSVVSPSGKRVTVRLLKADSQSFSDDFSYVFEKNVAKARSENRKTARAAKKV